METQLAEAPIDATRVARLLASSAGVRVALVNLATGAEFFTVPLASRTRESVAAALGVVGQLRARLAAQPTASPEAMTEVATLPDARLIELARAAHLPALAAAANAELGRRIEAARATYATLENDRLRWAWEAAYRSTSPRAWSDLKALEAVGAARGAKNPHDLLNTPTMTPVEVRKASLVEAVERTIAEARASLAEARAFVRERSHFEDLLPRESGIRSAHTSASDLEREYLPMAREALAYAQSLPRKSAPAPSPEFHGLLVRVEAARNAATEELPEETFDGDPLASAVLAAAPTEADLAHLLATGHAEEARRRIARLEALLAAARSGMTPGSLDPDAFRAPAGSFASFVAARPVPFAQRFAKPIADPVRPRPALPVSLPSVRYYGKELRGALPPSKITGGAQVLGPPRNPPTVADRRMVAHGIVEYDRALPDTAIASFDLVPLHATPQDAARDIVDLAVARGVLNYVQEYEESGMGGETAAITAARTLSERAGFRLSGQYSDNDLRPFLRAYMISRGMLAAPFSERFGAGAPEPIDASTQFARAANYAMARYRRTMASLKNIPPLKADAFRKRLGFPNWETEFHRAKTLPAINVLLKRLDAIDADVAPLAASYVRTPLTSFKAIVDWYQNELPNYYKITPADFRERVTIDRGSGHPIVLTTAALGALPIGRLLANRWWEAEPYEYAVRSALDAAIAAARQAGTRRDQPIPVLVRFHGIAEPTRLVARVVGDEIVLDVPSRFGAGAAEELRPRPKESLASRVERGMSTQDASANRSPPAPATAVKQIADAIDATLARFADGSPWNGAEFDAESRIIRSAYRSDLPRDDVGDELGALKERLNRSLKPYRNQIAKLDMSVGEKGWVDIFVALK